MVNSILGRAIESYPRRDCERAKRIQRVRRGSAGLHRGKRHPRNAHPRSHRKQLRAAWGGNWPGGT